MITDEVKLELLMIEYGIDVFRKMKAKLINSVPMPDMEDIEAIQELIGVFGIPLTIVYCRDKGIVFSITEFEKKYCLG